MFGNRSREPSRDPSKHDDRDVTFFLSIIAKVIFLAIVLWFATPHPVHCATNSWALPWY